MTRLSVLIPTYNERENVSTLLQRLLQTLAREEFQIVVIDDNSPDGTADLVESAFGADPRIRLLRRQGKMGLGSAILDGLRVSSGEYVVMMDADLSHQPEDLHKLLQVSDGADIVVGSRYLGGSRIQGWPLTRKIASRVAILIARMLLDLPVKDPTSGFALYRREIVEQLAGQLNPRGFKLLVEVLAKASTVRVKEVPITFHNRSAGASKFNLKEVVEFVRLCLRLRHHQKRTG